MGKNLAKISIKDMLIGSITQPNIATFGPSQNRQISKEGRFPRREAAPFAGANRADQGVLGLWGSRTIVTRAASSAGSALSLIEKL
jgi:hypothetical protein